jgi:YidC/Oxa1 family membrane protein insertase
MLALGPFQALLDAIGWVLAQIYDLVPNYGVSIILLTVLLRLVVLPLGIKQIKSMQAMQAIQPRVKELQKRYKGDKAKIQEEQMKLYKEAGVNPLGGCLPMLLQFPLLIAMYAVIRAPSLDATAVPPDPPAYYVVMNNHLPTNSTLFGNIIEHQDTDFLWMNLQCSPAQAGSEAIVQASVTTATQNDAGQEETQTDKVDVVPGIPINAPDGGGAIDNPSTGDPYLSQRALDCGNSPAAKIPYIVILLLMAATTFYQQRQMQKASPPNAASQQQQMIMKVFPLVFLFIGFSLPVGLGVYWTVSNLIMIGQQAFLLRAGHIGPDALDRRIAEQRARQASGAPVKQGFMARMMEKADIQRGESGKTNQDKPKSSSGSGKGELPVRSKSGKGRKPTPSSRSGQGSTSKGSSKGTSGSKGNFSKGTASKGNTSGSKKKSSGRRVPRKPGGSDGSGS